jgi:hypothetical protein
VAAKVFYRRNRGAEITVLGPLADQAAYRAGQALRGRVIANIRRLGRVYTGEMIQGMQARRINTGSPLIGKYVVGSSARHTAWQNDGTRAHGPVRASHLVFQVRGQGPVIFAKRVRGVTPGRFMEQALAAARPSDAAR